MKNGVKLEIEVSPEQLELLSVLDAHGDARATLTELVHRVADGVRRPGAWERAWLEQVFWGAWHARLEPDPEAYWRQRPRRRGRAEEDDG